MHTQVIITIITPVFNAEKYLPKCIESILNQTFNDFELILINDGSTDRSGQVCEYYAKRDKRIRLLHKQNGGASSARNAGIEMALGRYIGWVDADDFIDPDMFEHLYKLIIGYNADIADCQYIEMKGKTGRKSGSDEPIVVGSDNFVMYEFFSSRMKPGLWTKLYRRELWHNFRFPLGRNHQDFYANVVFALQPIKYVRSPKAKYHYIERKNSITTSRTRREFREALHMYDYIIDLVGKTDNTEAHKLLLNDAVNRTIIRFFELSSNSTISDQSIYIILLRKRLGLLSIQYLLYAKLPIKTRIGVVLMLLNLNSLNVFFRKLFSLKNYNIVFSF